MTKNQNTPGNGTAGSPGVAGPYPQVRIIEGLERPRFAIRGDVVAALAAKAGRDNPHQISMGAGIAYATARRYLYPPGTAIGKEPKAVDLETLFDILVRGAGVPWAELAELPFGSIFALLGTEDMIGLDLVISKDLVGEPEE